MKILMLTDYFYPHVGGVEKVTFEVSKRLMKVGCDVIIVTLNTEKAKDFEFLEGVKIYRIRSISLAGVVGAQLAISLYAPFKLLNVCKMENPDIIHINHRFFFTTLCALALRPFLKKRLIITLHTGKVTFNKRSLDLIVKIFEKTLTRQILKTCDKVIAVSDAIKRYVACLDASSNKVTVIPNGIDLDEFRPKENSGDKQNKTKRIVFVGRLISNKGIQYLVEAVPSIVKEYANVRFVIVGDGPLNNKLQKRTRDLGVEGLFEFLGAVNNVGDVLRKCDIFVLPSLSEGMSLTLLEAMACRLPIVATNVGGTPEIVINNKTGLLVEPGNVEQLARSILKLVGNEKLRRELGRNARLFIEKRHSWDECAKSTMRVYEETLKNNI